MNVQFRLKSDLKKKMCAYAHFKYGVRWILGKEVPHQNHTSHYYSLQGGSHHPFPSPGPSPRHDRHDGCLPEVCIAFVVVVQSYIKHFITGILEIGIYWTIRIIEKNKFVIIKHIIHISEDNNFS